VSPKLQTALRRTAVVALSSSAAVAVLAGPAAADVPEGWSSPEEISTLYALLVLGGIPLALFLLITLVVYIPGVVRGGRKSDAAASVQGQWFGGPRKGTAELAGPDTEKSEAGGASGRW
jgi:hypothetical protein